MLNMEVYVEKKANDDNSDLFHPYKKKNNIPEDSTKRDKWKYFKETICDNYFIMDERLFYNYSKNTDKIIEKKFLIKLKYLIFFLKLMLIKYILVFTDQK